MTIRRRVIGKKNATKTFRKTIPGPMSTFRAQPATRSYREDTCSEKRLVVTIVLVYCFPTIIVSTIPVAWHLETVLQLLVFHQE